MKLKLYQPKKNSYKVLRKNNSPKSKIVFAITFVAILFFTTTSCSKDEDKMPEAPALIIGKWEYQKQDTRDGQTLVISEPAVAMPSCVKNYLDIKADNKIDLVNHSAPCVAEKQSFAYTINNNIISYSSANRTIEKLTSTELILTEPSAPYITVYYLKKVP